MTPTVMIIEIVSTTKTNTDFLFTVFLRIGSLRRVAIGWFVVGPADQKNGVIDTSTAATTLGLSVAEKSRIGRKSVSSCNKTYAGVFVDLALWRLVRLALFATA
jgi:hypothetical protein